MAISNFLMFFGWALLVFAGVLGYRRERKRAAAEGKWVGSALEVNLIAPRVQEVRRDYVAAVHHPSHHTSHRAAWIRTARHVLARLGYFRSCGRDDAESHSIVTAHPDCKA